MEKLSGNRCGACIHARKPPLNPNDLKGVMRYCAHSPPQITVLPQGKGIAVQSMYPAVLDTDEACGQFAAQPAAKIVT